MGKFKEYIISSTYEFRIDLCKYLPEDGLCRQLEKIVSELDTDAIESHYSELGQNALHPKMMLSIIFYGYATGIRSGRKLSSACKENLPFIYLSKGHKPCKSVFNDFRLAHHKHFTALFTQVIKKCVDSGLIVGDLEIVDGSKIEANSAKRRTKTKEGYEKWQENLLGDIEELKKKQCAESTSESGRLEARKKMASKERLSAKISRAITTLEGEADGQTMNLTDPDAPIMKGKKGNFDTNYNTQASCGENQVISYCNVVIDGNDKAQLIPVLKGIAENTGSLPKVALADADYGNFDSFEYMANQGIEGYVPYRDMNTTYADKPYHKSHFEYDAFTDTYSCPAGQTLLYYADYENKKRKQNYKKYRTNACKQCPFKSECCPKGTARRVIQRENREGLREQMKQRLKSPEGKKIYQKRLHPIEAIFGHFKYNLGYRQFSLRGLEKVNAEFTLMCLAHNLRKIVAKLAYFLHILLLNVIRGENEKQYCTAL